MTRARVPRATVTRVACNNEGNGGGSSNGDGNNTDNDKEDDNDNNDKDYRDLEPAVHNDVISAASSTCPRQPQQ
jgi:hypothetical protein